MIKLQTISGTLSGWLLRDPELPTAYRITIWQGVEGKTVSILLQVEQARLLAKHILEEVTETAKGTES